MKKLDNIIPFLCRLGYKLQRIYYRRFPARISTEIGRPYTRDMAKNCIGKGWAPLIDRIYNYVGRTGAHMTVFQVKEKFGGLRFYFAAHESIYKFIERVVDECEAESFKICEICGKPGEANCPEGDYWIRTTCEEHR